MRIGPGGAWHLGYCTNVHAANGWKAVRAAIEGHALPLRAALAPERPFGLGLRLSAAEARELSEPRALAAARAFLDAHGLYVFALNGFPYGAFHGQRVKEGVFAPDWRQPARAAYTVRLARILAGLLPDGLVEGGVSTCPLSYRGWGGAAELALMAGAIASVVADLARLEAETGKRIHLDLEPEPDGLVETSRELVRWFEDVLLPVGRGELARRLGVPPGRAEALLHAHVRACWDTCHLAVLYERPKVALHRLAAAGLQVGRLQISSALRVPWPAEPRARADMRRRLIPFAESTYLHQVVERRQDGTRARHRDLVEALAAPMPADAAEWRIHFHVPLFASDLAGGLATTAEDARTALGLQLATPFTRVLEIETYTWGVLPAGLAGGLAAMIAREYRWTLSALGGALPRAA